MAANLLLAPGPDGVADVAPILTGSTLYAPYVATEVDTGLVATGTNEATALPLSAAINVVATVASGTGVVLPTVASVGVGVMVDVYNNGAAILKVYGSSGDTVDGVAGTTGVSLTYAHRCKYTAVAAGTWISAQLGVVSA